MIQKLILVTSNIVSIFLGVLDTCSCKAHTINDNYLKMKKIHVISKKSEDDKISEMIFD
jgi:hypothetical protein